MRPVVLIVGASGALGAELAALRAGRGEVVLGAGRRRPTEWPAERWFTLDLAAANAGPRLAGELATRGFSRLDRLIHAAGIGVVAAPGELAEADLDGLLAANLFGPLAVTHALGAMLRAARGEVVFVSSVVAAAPSPDYAAYAAAKAALEAFVRSWREEVRGELRVRIVRPGAFRSGFHAAAGLAKLGIDERRFPHAAVVAWAFDRWLEGKSSSGVLGWRNELVWHVATIWPGLARWRAKPRLGPGGLRPAGASHGLTVVTGAAQGIGAALAEECRRRGGTVAGIDVQGEAPMLNGDLGDPADVRRLAAELRDQAPIGELVHNAGINRFGRFLEVPWEEHQRVLDVNLRGPLALTAAVLKNEALASAAKIGFVASLSCQVGYPGAAVYAASKAGLASYAESLHAALRPHGGVAWIVFPGPTRTEHARQHSPDNAREHRRMPPGELARRIGTARRRGQRRIFPGWQAKLAAFAGHWCPGLVTRLMARGLLKASRTT